MTEPALHGGEEPVVPCCIVFPYHLESNAVSLASDLEKSCPSDKKRKVAAECDDRIELAIEYSASGSIDGGKNHVVQPEAFELLHDFEKLLDVDRLGDERVDM